MGGKSTSTSQPKVNQISVQSSALGLPVAIGWGRARVSPNLLWYGGFTAIAHTTKQSAGKGLGGGVSSTSYTYTASIILGICEGGATGIQGVRTVYRDKSVLTLAGADLSLAVGTPTQSTWGYLTTRYPGQAINYSGLAYAYAQDYALNDSATLPNHSFEVDFGIQLAVAANGDADPKDILTDFFTNTAYGVPSWPSGAIGDLSDWSLYCRANNLLLSPVLDSQRAANDIVSEWMIATNSEAVWSEGLLKVGTYGDASATANTVTWNPNLTPAYDLTEDDFIPVDGKPVKLEIVDQSDAYNIVQIEFLDRTNQYNSGIAPAHDLANIAQYGRRKQDPTTVHSICDPTIAMHSAQLLLQRTLYMRERYTFTIPDCYALLEPMIDTVTLTTTTDELKLNRKQVRLVEITETPEGTFACTAIGMDVGVASAALYNAHSASGYVPNLDVAPGSVSTPVLINAPTSLTGGAAEVWIAAASTNTNWGGCEVWVSADNIQYQKVGSITAAARLGVSTATLASHADPDTVDTLAVDLTSSNGSLSSSNAANANIGSTLCLIGTEIVSYQTATLTGANLYNLTNLRRGLYGTTIAAHASGQTFARLDEALFKYDYGSLALGTTMYVKLPSFNIYGRALEDISTVPAYTVQLSPNVTVGTGSLQAFTLVNRANCYIDGRTVTKITGTNSAWDASVVSSESFIGGCMCGFQPLQTNAEFMIGFNTDPATNDSYTSIDYGWDIQTTGNCLPYMNGSPVSGAPLASYAVGDTFQITYQGSTVTWLHNGSVVATQTVASGLQLWLDSSFSTVGGKATNITFAGSGGSNGNNTAVVTLYQRSTTAPTLLPSVDITYTFATQAMSPAPNNSWSATMPAANGQPLWVTQATAFGSGSTDTIVHTEWSSPVQFTADGLNTATVFLYQRAAAAPTGSAATPSATLTYTFSNGALTPAGSLNGWSQTIPTGTNPCWVIQATASAGASVATDTILTTEWSAPSKLVQDGAQGAAGASTFTLVNRSNMTINGGTVTKTGGTSAWGNGSVVSAESFVGGAACSFKVVDGSHQIMIALNSDPNTDDNFTSLDYAWYLSTTGFAQIWESNSYTSNQTPFVAGDTLQIVYSGTSVTYSKNGTTIYQHTGVAANQTLFLDSAFNEVGGSVTNLTFAKAGADGTGGSSSATQLQQLSVTSNSGGTTTVYMYSNFFQVAAGATTPVTWDGLLSYNSGSGSTNGQNTIEWSTNNWSTFTQIGSASASVPIDSSGGSGADLAINTSYTNSTGSAVRVQFRVKLTRSNANVSFNESGYLGVG